MREGKLPYRQTAHYLQCCGLALPQDITSKMVLKTYLVYDLTKHIHFIKIFEFSPTKPGLDQKKWPNFELTGHHVTFDPLLTCKKVDLHIS